MLSSLLVARILLFQSHMSQFYCPKSCRSYHPERFQVQLEEHDRSVDECCHNIKLSLDSIVSKQRQLADTFGELIDEVLRAPIQSVHDDDEATRHDEFPGHVPSPHHHSLLQPWFIHPQVWLENTSLHNFHITLLSVFKSVLHNFVYTVYHIILCHCKKVYTIY